MFVDEKLYASRPEEKLSELETKIYDTLDELGITYERAVHDHADTIEECLEVEKVLGAEICKNLLVCNAQKTLYIFVMMPGGKKFLTKLLSKQLGTARLSFASPDALREILGVGPGSVSVLELVNEGAKDVRLVIDEDLLTQDHIGCHPGLNNATLRLKTSDIIEKFIPYTGRSPEYVKL